MPVLEIFICAYKKSGSYYNGGHRTSNGYVCNYTEIDKTIVYLSIPFILLNDGISKEIRSFFSGTINKSVIYTDWENESKGIEETEIDISQLILRLNKNYHPPYSQYVFKQGNQDNCPFEAGDYTLFPLISEKEDLR